MSDLLTDGPTRWKPSRAGIHNIWEYDHQVFEFSDGRLILRGPNGSGKSNALALFVPFLLDGIMAASRMDSLGGGRSMKTLLLCLNDDEGSKHYRHEQRTGYAWLELQRTGDDGHLEHVTIGCGARASTQRDAEAWFFVTPQRPGVDLDLVSGGVPLTKGGLRDVVGAEAVHDSADAYRTAVDRTLFGLGAHRYGNLIDLLLVLRRPHLAGKLDLTHLSKVLSDGLAALDEQLIADVAASFEDLEAVQRDLARIKEAHATVDVFLPIYRRYIQATARQRSRAVLDANRLQRAARQRVDDARTAAESADAEVERIRGDLARCLERTTVADERKQGVLASPAYRDAISLADVEQNATNAETHTRLAAERVAFARTEHDDAEAVAGREATALMEAEGAVDRAYASAAETADLAGISWPVGRDALEAGELPSTLRALATERRGDIEEVRRALQVAAEAAHRADGAMRRAEESSYAADAAELARREAAAAVDRTRELLRAEVRDWVTASGIDELVVVVDGVDLLGEPAGPSMADLVNEALRSRHEALAARDAVAEGRVDELTAEIERVRIERQRVADGPVPAPDPQPTRPGDRTQRAGAPLYACCDFADHVPASERAGLEAAIEAAGLLDAWLGPMSDELDAWLVASPATGGVVSPSLADVLVPTPPSGDASPSVGEIESVLSSIALADAGIAVLPDGRYRLGPLTGRYEKSEAELIGATARERRRQRLLAELDATLTDLRREVEVVETERASVVAERDRLDEVAAAMPSTRALVSVRDALLAAIATAHERRTVSDREAEAAREARRIREQRHAELRDLAAERRLTPTADGLETTEQHVRAYDQRASELVGAMSDLGHHRRAEKQAIERLDRGAQTLQRCEKEHDDARVKAAGLRARVDELCSQLGADADAPLRELEAIESELLALRDQHESLTRANGAAHERRGKAVRELEVALEAVDKCDSEATEAAGAVDVLRRDDLWTLAVGTPRGADRVWPTAADGAAPADAGALASAVVKATAEVADEPDDNALQRAYRVLLDELGRGYDPGLSYVDHVAVVDVTSEQGTFSILWLADELAAQVARQQELLSERDREIFERHLLTRVSEALRELLNDGDELIGRINESLARRPTASGKSVQLRWELGTDDAAVRRAVALLRKTPELLGPDEREQLRRFFSTAIGQRRAEDPSAGYAEILHHVLDYRTWHAFVPHVRSAGGGSQRLTRTLFRTLSGGEQAVVLHLPLFAAAAAHYDAANSTAPRLIALDEAFAGIDEGMRAELMGLLVRFDLDVLLTGHELWGAYEQVPSTMIYDLLRQPPLEGVSAFAVRWDGAAMAEA